jgi:hypothetical protein
MDVKLLIPSPIPDDVYQLAQAVKLAFQHKTVDLALLQKMGLALWYYANLPVDMSNISALIIEQYQDLPWEYLYHPQHYFIAQKIPITRQLSINSFKSKLINQPVKMLHFATQNQHDKRNYLSFAEEKYFIYQALWSQIQAKQILLHSALCVEFKQLAAQLAQNWDIIILSGHSINKNNQQYLVFDSGQLISYEQIATILQKISVQCVILAFCESHHLALRLHKMGISHVIGMQYSVLDRAASVFIQQFCLSLSQAHSIKTILQTARLAMQNLLKNNEQWQENEIGQWLIPCMYARSNTDNLFYLKPVKNKIHTILPKILIGRDKQLYKLVKALSKYQKVWLYGAGGIGKTALAQAVQQHFLAQHQTIMYIEVENYQQVELVTNENMPILAVSRLQPPNQDWMVFSLFAPTEIEFIRYAQYQGLAYPDIQLRLIYKMLRGNYQGLHLLQGLPFSTDAKSLRQQLRTVQRYLQAYQR